MIEDRDGLRLRVQGIFADGSGWRSIRLGALVRSMHVPESTLVAALAGGVRYRLIKRAGVLWLMDSGTPPGRGSTKATDKDIVDYGSRRPPRPGFGNMARAARMLQRNRPRRHAA